MLAVDLRGTRPGFPGWTTAGQARSPAWRPRGRSSAPLTLPSAPGPCCSPGQESCLEAVGQEQRAPHPALCPLDHCRPGQEPCLEAVGRSRAPLTLPSAPRPLLLASLVAVLLLEVGSARIPQVRVQTKGKVGAEQDTEVWDARAAESLEKDNQLIWLLMAPKLMATSKEQKGAKAPAETEDALGHVPGPREGPEPDWDSLFHDGPEEAPEEARPWARVLPPRQVLHGPEEDRDHIYHPREP